MAHRRKGGLEDGRGEEKGRSRPRGALAGRRAAGTGPGSNAPEGLDGGAAKLVRDDGQGHRQTRGIQRRRERDGGQRHKGKIEAQAGLEFDAGAVRQRPVAGVDVDVELLSRRRHGRAATGFGADSAGVEAVGAVGQARHGRVDGRSHCGTGSTATG